MTGKPIDADLVRAVVEAHGLDWQYHEETGSTNADALQHHDTHRREVVVFGESQRAGRGRRGRQWLSPPRHNLYCTIGLGKTLPANQRGLLSIVTGLALCRALETRVDADIGLKWPNDLLGDGRKFGGILIESRPSSDDEAFFAIGFGINLFMPRHELEAIETPATSLGELSTGEIDRSELLLACIDAVVGEIRDFDSDVAENLAAAFAERDLFHDKEIEVHTPGGVKRGINRGITPGGELRVETGQGIELHSAAEISLRPIKA